MWSWVQAQVLGILVWGAWHCSRICLQESWCAVAPTVFPRFLMVMEVCRHPWHVVPLWASGTAPPCSSSLLFLLFPSSLPPSFSSALHLSLHLLLPPSCFILVVPLQSSLFSSSPSLHDTVTTAPYYSLFKFCSGNQKHSPETALQWEDHGPSARRHPGTRESKDLSRLAPHK